MTDLVWKLSKLTSVPTLLDTYSFTQWDILILSASHPPALFLGSLPIHVWLHPIDRWKTLSEKKAEERLKMPAFGKLLFLRTSGITCLAGLHEHALALILWGSAGCYALLAFGVGLNFSHWTQSSWFLWPFCWLPSFGPSCCNAFASDSARYGEFLLVRTALHFKAR